MPGSSSPPTARTATRSRWCSATTCRRRPNGSAFASSAAEPATVFVAGDRRTVRILNRKLERRFAGHPLLGAAAVLRAAGLTPTTFLTAAGEVPVWNDDGLEWLSAPAEWSPPTRPRRVSSVADGLGGRVVLG
ncbi:hypothetical protein [Kribbella flavida]|uniref:hypothetical protein n=1 Tax=Kribbella flavida TaxID=182640 RepID=UPI00019BD90B|nr:hypothetical protein [Kribbella flavida]